MDDTQIPEVTITYVTSTESEARIANALEAGTKAGKKETMSLLTESLRNHVDSGDMEKDLAKDIWTETNAGDSDGNPFWTTFTVTVSLDGNDLFEVNEVEADDAQEACDSVAQDMSVDDITVSVTIRHGNGWGHSDSCEIDDLDSSYYTVNEDAILEALEYNAEPED